MVETFTSSSSFVEMSRCKRKRSIIANGTDGRINVRYLARRWVTRQTRLK